MTDIRLGGYYWATSSVTPFAVKIESEIGDKKRMFLDKNHEWTPATHIGEVVYDPSGFFARGASMPVATDELRELSEAEIEDLVAKPEAGHDVKVGDVRGLNVGDSILPVRVVSLNQPDTFVLGWTAEAELLEDHGGLVAGQTVAVSPDELLPQEVVQ